MILNLLFYFTIKNDGFLNTFCMMNEMFSQPTKWHPSTVNVVGLASLVAQNNCL